MGPFANVAVFILSPVLTLESENGVSFLCEFLRVAQRWAQLTFIYAHL